MRRLVRLAIAVAATTILVTSLGGCAALPLLAALPGPGYGSSTSTGTGSTGSQTEHYSDGSTSVRGNIPKVIGEKAGILNATGTVREVTFTVTKITVDPTCLQRGGTGPAFGHFVEVDLHVVTTAALGTDSSGSTVGFGPADWSSYDVGDDVHSYEAWNAGDVCSLSLAPLPDHIGPSQDVTGSILLDVAGGTAYLAYTSECGCDSWEWPAPAALATPAS